MPTSNGIWRSGASRRGTSTPPSTSTAGAWPALWRLWLQDRASDGWQEVHEYGRARFAVPAAHFIEWHLAMAAAGAGEPEAIDARLSALPQPPPGPVFCSACRAFGAFATGDYLGVVSLLEPMTQEFVRMGGSGAQHEVLAATLDAARKRLRR
jgi:hypothetical protein